jgi:methyl-accepting chemotaxis protein
MLGVLQKMSGSVGRRLSLSFGLLIALMLVMAVLGGAQLATLSARMKSVVEVNNAKTALGNAMLHSINAMGLHARSLTLLTEAKEIEAELKQFQASVADYEKDQKALAAAVGEDAAADERKLLAEIQAAAQQALPLAQKAAKEGAEGQNIDATMTLNGAVKPAETAWRGKVMAFVKAQDQASREAADAMLASSHRALWLLGLISAAAVAIGSLLAHRIRIGITRPVDRAIVMAERIANGDLSSSYVAESDDELGRLLAGLAAMQDKLRSLVGEIRSAADSIQTASAEVATGNQDLSMRTEQAASNLQQTASSMEQLTGGVNASADAAAQANQLASSAASVASRGGEVVGQVVATMSEIRSSSARIGDIIGVIDGIAFQTNILALNAAVEAARAGEQGRGFAVVASEVRSLAGRSAEAAKEIKQLVGRSVQTVESGSHLVDEAGSTMGEIVASVKRVADIIAEVSAGAREQGSGIAQINQAVNQLDQMTQQNAALVEESTAAAEQLREQAVRLSGLVSAFTLDRSQR